MEQTENNSDANEGAWRQALLNAASYIERHGWCQRQSQRNDGATCMVGAVATVCVYSVPYTRAIKELEQSVGQWPVGWNDEPGRKQEEVVSKLRECAGRSVAEQSARPQCQD